MTCGAWCASTANPKAPDKPASPKTPQQTTPKSQRESYASVAAGDPSNTTGSRFSVLANDHLTSETEPENEDGEVVSKEVFDLREEMADLKERRSNLRAKPTNQRRADLLKEIGDEIVHLGHQITKLSTTPRLRVPSPVGRRSRAS